MYPRHYRPLIIVGRQRAGTRFVTELLNTFEEVTLQGEVPNTVLESGIRMIREVEQYYAKGAKSGTTRRTRAYEYWTQKKVELQLAIWETAGQGRRIKPGPETRFFGYKRPNNEQYFEYYEDIFRLRSPSYIYCTRNFVDNFLSISSRWPDREIGGVAADYLASCDRYQIMKATAPQRVLLFNLDDHIRLGISYIQKEIIGPLGLKLTSDHRKRLMRMRARNRTEHDARMPRRKTLTIDEQTYINDHPEIDIAYRKLCVPDN